MRTNGSYALLQEEVSRSQALNFLVENAVAVPMQEGEDEASVEAGAAHIANDEREEG
jgi:hypothetical protein